MGYEFGDVVYAEAIYTNLSKSKNRPLVNMIKEKLGSFSKPDRAKLKNMLKRIIG